MVDYKTIYTKFIQNRPFAMTTYLAIDFQSTENLGTSVQLSIKCSVAKYDVYDFCITFAVSVYTCIA